MTVILLLFENVNMKKLMNILLIISLVCSLPSCKPDDCPEPIENQSPVVWKKLISSSPESSLNSTPLLYKDLIVLGKKETSGYVIRAYNAYAGDTIWETMAPVSGGFNATDWDESMIYDNKIVFSESYWFFALDAVTGKILWHKINDNFFGGSCVIDKYLYKMGTDHRNWSSLYRFEINSGAKEKLFTINRSEYGSNYSPNLMMPVKWVHPNGDEILVLQNRTYGWYTDMEHKMDILAWNLTADSMLWYRDRLDGFSSMSRPAIDGDKVYFYGDRHAYCINPLNGETIWKYFIGDGPEDDFNTANILIIDEKLIVKPDNDHMHAVNKETGEMIWRNNETASMPDLLTVHQDTIWFGSGGVLAIDANTGKTLIDQYEASNGSWIFPIAHHPTNGHIYTSDGDYLYCLNPKYMR